MLAEAERDTQGGEIGKDFIDKYIDKIFVTPLGENRARLDIKIFTGESTERYLSRLRSRAGRENPEIVSENPENMPNPVTDFGVRPGHMSRKMIEAYENGMK